MVRSDETQGVINKGTAIIVPNKWRRRNPLVNRSIKLARRSKEQSTLRKRERGALFALFLFAQGGEESSEVKKVQRF